MFGFSFQSEANLQEFAHRERTYHGTHAGDSYTTTLIQEPLNGSPACDLKASQPPYQLLY